MLGKLANAQILSIGKVADLWTLRLLSASDRARGT
jgi:hypothetical protein